ncbi:MAG: outer membrane beta-barrel protein, partial [Flavobacteriaceae bacterium]
GLQSVTYKNRNYIVAVGNRGTLKPPPSNLPTMTEDGVPIVPRSGITPGTMTQQLDYFEIPLELKYALLDSKIGLNLIGGMSTLLLNSNEVSIASDGFSSTIGSANNLNEFSFSTNIGFGLDYKFSKRFIFNLEPMFKYQINPYSDNSVDFKPYYLGVYSGFSYRF